MGILDGDFLSGISWRVFPVNFPGGSFVTATVLFIMLLVFALAWSNGANDISKGVATLVGSGAAHPKGAVIWGTLWTVLGGAAAMIWGGALISTFSTGYLSPGFQVDFAFVAATMAGACFWILLATRMALPVSTTHALLGGVVGAALAAAGSHGLRLEAVTNQAVLPLLLSPLLAIVLCVFLLGLARYVSRLVPQWSPGCCDKQAWRRNPFICAGPEDAFTPSPRTEKLLTCLHWLSSGVTSFARALNDVPKIAAFLILAAGLIPEATGESNVGSGEGITVGSTVESLAGATGEWLHGHPYPAIFMVAVFMGLGSLWGGFRVLKVLSHRITRLDSASGLAANLGTSALVLAASFLGMPVSTTHVSTGSLMGMRWSNRGKPSRADALKGVLSGWLITLPVAALVAGMSSWLLKMGGVQ